MKKLFLIIIALFIASTCLARTDVLSNQGTYVYGNTTQVGVSAISLGTTDNVISVFLKPNVNNTGFIYIGDSNVSTTGGLSLASGNTLQLNLQTFDNLYAISNLASQKVDVGYIK